MSVISYLLLISLQKVLHCLHRVLNSRSLGMSLDLTNAFIHCAMCPWETEYVLIAAENNSMRTNHIKARIDKTQQNSKYRLCCDRDETINHIISELEQKEYKTIQGWVGKVIYWELCKKFKFDHTNKWYRHNPTSLLENDTYKLLWDFNLQTDHLISARRRDLIIINKRKRKENLLKLRNMQVTLECSPMAGTIEEMKEAVTKVIDTRGLPWDLPEVIRTVQVHCSRRRLLRRGLEFHVYTINKSAHTKKVWKLI